MNLGKKLFFKTLQYSVVFLFLSILLSCATIGIPSDDSTSQNTSSSSNYSSSYASSRGIVTDVIPGETAIISDITDEQKDEIYLSRILKALPNSRLPQSMSAKIEESITNSRDFINELLIIVEQDQYLWKLVDKQHPLGRDYEPEDLVILRSASYNVNDNYLMLRFAAAASLEEMAAAAKNERITLVVSYAYRSFTRQTQSYEMHVRNMGQREADRISARPGFSQHQLGFVVDFGAVNNTFARTSQGLWLAKNASRFGWSLSYPEGYEAVTGYRWESWHYRYVGLELAAFIDKYFDGIQQYALQFIQEYAR